MTPKPEMKTIAADLAIKMGIGVSDSTKVRGLIDKGWDATYRELFGNSFVDILAPHHIEAIEWHWVSRLALLTGEKPEFYAYFPIWSRANMKSSIAERMVIIDAVLSYAYSKPGYCLYLGREKHRIQENIQNIETLLSEPKVKEWCPDLSEVKINTETNQKRKWTGTFLHTKAGYIIKGGTVDSTQAGSRIGETRVTFTVPDDIDGREDSEVIAENRFRKLTTEILPMRQEDSLVFFAQNLISRYSVMYRIHTGRAAVLTNRKPTEPVPAVRDLVTEQRTVNGIVKDVVISGKPTWKAWTLDRVQNEIDTYGLQAFERECQHNVAQSKEGLVVKTYDDNVHPISYSEFASIYGSPDAWKDWFKVPANDWARTKTKYHANVAAYLAVSSQNTKLPGFTFIIPYSFKADTQPEDVAERLLTELTPYAYGKKTWKDLIAEAWKRLNSEQHFTSVVDRLSYLQSYYASVIPKYSRKILSLYNVKMGAMSHSEDKVRTAFNKGFGFSFVPSNPTKIEAIEDIIAAFKVDHEEDHPFRDQKGYTRTFVLCADDTDRKFEVINGVDVYPPVAAQDAIQPDNLHDDELFRYQMMNFRYRDPKLTELGENIDDILKLNDDFFQLLQMVYSKKLLANIKLTKEEKIEEIMPQGLKQAVIAEVEDPMEKIKKLNARRFQERKIDKALQPKGRSRNPLKRLRRR